MKLVKQIAILGVFVLAAVAGAQAQNYYAGSQSSIFPNYNFPTQTFTAASTTGSTLGIGGVRSGVIEVTGTALTTATWSIQGSIDGGVTWLTLPTAVYPTTTVPVTTTALTQTTTTSGTFYVVSLGDFSNIRFVTTSATFTATNIVFHLSVSSNNSYL